MVKMHKLPIHKPIAVSMVLIAVMVLGIVAIKKLPVSLVPNVDIPQITVQVASPNKSAREINETMIAPLRAQLAQIPHLEQISCTSKDGSGIISLIFEFGSDASYIFIDVNERIDRAMANWPNGEERPIVARASATDIPAFFINITLADSIYTENQLLEMSDFARHIILRRIEQLSEVAMVDISGQMFPELLIVPNMEKIQSLGISEQQLSNAITNSNVRLGNLSIHDGEYQFNVRFESTIVTRQDIENIWLKINGRIYQIKDLAEVREQPQMKKGMISSDGKQCITLAVIKRTDARMANLKANMDTLMEVLRKDYPFLEFTVTRDQTELLDYSINNMIKNLLFGALFACIIIFLFMQDFKSPLLVVVTIPTAIVLSFLLFFALGISINIISLSGLIIGLGMMVDNSIITIDNITQRWQQGLPIADACVCGTKEVFRPMLSSVLTTCAIFVPLIFISGIAGALFYDEAMGVAISLVSALLVSVLVIPVFYKLLYQKQSRFAENRHLHKLGVDRINYGYERLLKWFFRHRVVMWCAFGASAICIGLLFVALDKQKLPALSHTDTLIKIEWNERINAEDNDSRCRQIVSHFNNIVEQSTCMSGIQQFLLSHTDETSISEAIIYIKAQSADDIKLIEQNIGNVIGRMWPKAVYSYKASGNIFDMIFSEKEAALVAKIKTTNGMPANTADLEELLSDIRQAVCFVNIQPLEWNEYIELIADPERMALYNVDYEVILQHLRKAMNSNTILRISKGDASEPVSIGVGQKQAAELISYNVQASDGTPIPLGILLRETRNRDLKKINSGADGEYYPLTLSINNNQVESAMKAIREIVKNDGRFDVSFSGAYFTNKTMINELCNVLLISVLLLFLILAAQFESLVQPLIIMSELIIDIMGPMMVLWILGESLNLMSMIGIIVMCGIVINDSILKVDTINRLRQEGKSLKHAIMEAGSRRLKAILMTSLTTILAIAPFLVRGDMGSDLQYPLSLTLVAGMVVGTFVSIFFVPLAYYSIYRKSESKAN